MGHQTSTEARAFAPWRRRRDHVVGVIRDMAPGNAPIDVGLRMLKRDAAIRGGILAGGMAYRLFFWTLALAVLLTGGLGFIPGSRLQTGARQAGLTSQVASTVAQASDEAHSGRVALVGIGVVLVLVTSWGVLRTVRLVHAAAWRIPTPMLERGPHAVAAVVAGPFVIGVLAGLAGLARSHVSLPVGVLIILVWGCLIGGLWLLASLRLPRRDAPWTALVPGAATIAGGAVAIHLLTIYYLANKLATASALYGTLGLTATLLVYLFMIGRLIVIAAELNAVVWERSHPTSGDATTEQLP